MEPTFEQYVEEYGSVLECPSCRGNYLRHGRVEIFERVEDSDSGIHVSVSDGAVTVDTDLLGNPSSRRHGLCIHFICEQCSATLELTVAQHKGNTWVDFRKT
jgi:hypothetical protein